MQLLHETPAGFMLFEINQKSTTSTNFIEVLSDITKKNELVTNLFKLKKFKPFSTTIDATASATALIEGKLGKPLKKFLKKNVKNGSDLAVADSKLGKVIKRKLGISCENSSTTNELLRVLRTNLDELLPSSTSAIKAMSLGLSHALSRYKLKFSPEKVDTMIVNSINLLDDIDKELNTYSMRVREWYGWHFPELGKLVPDNLTYAKIVVQVGFRINFKSSDLSGILQESVEQNVKNTCEISMGTDISDDDIKSVQNLASEVISLSSYRNKLFDYLKNRMQTIAPNLTVLVGELVGARLIAQSGSLLNLAKAPASTVQILGAEKALFRALKTKHDTPKYGLLYHASLVGQAAPKNKGKMSRMLAAKASLASRVDALGEEVGVTIGKVSRDKIEQRLRILEEADPIKRRTLERQFVKYKRQDSVKEVNDDENDVNLDRKRKVSALTAEKSTNDLNKEEAVGLKRKKIK